MTATAESSLLFYGEQRANFQFLGTRFLSVEGLNPDQTFYNGSDFLDSGGNRKIIGRVEDIKGDNSYLALGDLRHNISNLKPLRDTQGKIVKGEDPHVIGDILSYVEVIRNDKNEIISWHIIGRKFDKDNGIVGSIVFQGPDGWKNSIDVINQDGTHEVYWRRRTERSKAGSKRRGFFNRKQSVNSEIRRQKVNTLSEINPNSVINDSQIIEQVVNRYYWVGLGPTLKLKDGSVLMFEHQGSYKNSLWPQVRKYIIKARIIYPDGKTKNLGTILRKDNFNTNLPNDFKPKNTRLEDVVYPMYVNYYAQDGNQHVILGTGISDSGMGEANFILPKNIEIDMDDPYNQAFFISPAERLLRRL